MDKNYAWQFCSLGGVTRVMINKGEDIAHLGELDQKFWTVLSCPTTNLNIDPETIKLIDTDNDGKIRVAEVISTANRLVEVIKDKDKILNGDTVLPLSEINTDNEAGAILYKSAKNILKNLGSDDNEISLAQASDSTAIFAGTKFNGDGVITTLSTDDEQLKATISNIISCYPQVMDRCGEEGVNETTISAFYQECSDYANWNLKANDSEVLPYSDKTPEVLNIVKALSDKISEFFTLCKLQRFDEKTAQAVAITATSLEEIVNCPISSPNVEGLLNFKAINPAWQTKISTLKALIPEIENKDNICEAEWNELCNSLNAYSSWIDSKAGCVVESLGIERINTILAENHQSALIELVNQDKLLEAESNSIDDVKHLMLLYRDFYRFLQNFVTFTDFYKREPRAIFEVGKLYIDQRCCNLCIEVSDMSKHADMAKLSGMFLIYCTCTSIKKGKTMDIVAVLTEGNNTDIIVGKNGVFYDCNGEDWDATVTKVVENPISIKLAFFAPYKKFWDFCVGLINKSATEKDQKITENLQSKASTIVDKTAEPATDEKEKKVPFDIAKFAGIFAAIGLALGTIGSFLTGLANGVKDNPIGLLYAILAIMLIISGPSCFIAWSKLRKRNLGSVLNANGWAINSKILVNIIFGTRLTEVAKYPVSIRKNDPYVKKKSNGWKWLLLIVLLAIVAFLLFQYGLLAKIFV